MSVEGTLNWAPGDGTPRTISVNLTADNDFEPNEAFALLLSNPQNATPLVYEVNGHIENDDTFGFASATNISDRLVVSVNNSGLILENNGEILFDTHADQGVQIDVSGQPDDSLTLHDSSTLHTELNVDLFGNRTLKIGEHVIQLGGSIALDQGVLAGMSGVPELIFAERPLSLSALVPSRLNTESLSYQWKVYSQGASVPTVIGADAAFNFVPQEQQVLVELTVSDGLSTAVVTQEIHVFPPNVPPVANADVNDTTENTSVTTDVIANDTDLNVEDVLSLVPGSANLVSMSLDVNSSEIPVNTAIISENGNSILFDPASDFDHLAVGETATVVIAYEVTDGDESAHSTLTLTIHGENDAPVARDDTAVTNEDLAVTIDVLANDTDVDQGAVLGVMSVTQGVHGTVTTDGLSVTYTPNLGFFGNDSFEYTVRDEHGATSTATVDVNVLNLVDVSGRVFNDLDNDGAFEPADGDAGIDDVKVEVWDEAMEELFGSTTTAADGRYFLDVNLDAGTYRIVEVVSELDDLGLLTNPHAVNAAPAINSGANGVNDEFSGLTLAPGSTGDFYNFGERPQAGDPVGASSTATIGFWHNKHGQALIEGLNGDAQSTLLGKWLAETFPEMYGPGAMYVGANGDSISMNFSNVGNQQVAEVFAFLHRRNKKSAVRNGGTPKIDAQVLAVALATYSTSENLIGLNYNASNDPMYDFTDAAGDGTYDPGDGDAAIFFSANIAHVQSFGFTTSQDGIAYQTFNVLSVLTVEEAADLGITLDTDGNTTIIDILRSTKP